MSRKIYSTIGNKITQKELADKLGVKHNAISSWENGVNSIDIDILFRVCQIFGVTVNDMYGIHNNYQPSTIAVHFDGDKFTQEQIERNKAFYSG
ncbi:helix-turn-helix transcriptional regulator [Coprococcus catus]|uniref:helix-turn-helix transcriptional regulator n=1 Tax=Coprococcus catus TaxID=116085 RepID=UPI001FE5E9A7|nr:helix-turn-helix transcriptional regulator [Coprococcus catus]